MKSCEEYQALIDMYLDNELTREQKHLFDTHISSCNECYEALSFAKSIRQTLTTLPEIDVPEDFNSVLRQRIAKECKAPRKTFAVYVGRYSALAACVVLAVVIGGGLSEFDFTKKGEEYDSFIAESTPVPTLVPNIVLQQNAGENSTPTKDKDISKSIPKTEKKTYKTTPSPTAEEKSIDVSATSSDVAPANEYQAENTPSMTALSGDENAPSPTSEAAASGSDSSLRIAESEVTPTVTLTIPAEHTLGALTVAEEFATAENGIYTADKLSFDKMLEAFDIGGISYTLNGTADEDTIIFTIYAE